VLSKGREVVGSGYSRLAGGTAKVTDRGNGCTSPIATVGHVAHAQLLLEPTAMMGTLTSTDHCYYYQH
jgi:hypothetical protein